MDSIRLSKEKVVAEGICAFARLLTGARALWKGCAPSAVQRIYYGNHTSHGDFVLIWASLPEELRVRTRPVAGGDYWNASGLRQWLAHEVLRGVVIDRAKTEGGPNPVEQMVAALDHGDSLILFPEGTRNTTDETLLPFKSGVYHVVAARPGRRVRAGVDREPESRDAEGGIPAHPAAVHAVVRRAAFASPPARRRRPSSTACATPCSRSRRRRPDFDPMRPELLKLFAGVFGLLVVASVAAAVLRYRLAAAGPNATLDNLNARIKAWWWMVILLGIAFAFGKGGVVVLFAFVSFLCLREFVSLTYTRRGDHWALALVFFFFLPLQFILVGAEWYGLYSVLIPVYAFLTLPIFAALSADTTRFFERASKLQAALMICVYCISYVPALMTLRIPGFEGGNLLLIAWLVLVVQSSDVLQYVWGKLFGRHSIAPALSPSKTVEGRAGRHRQRDAAGRDARVAHPVHRAAGRRHRGAGDAAGALRRPGDVRDQARPRRQGLGHDLRGPRRDAGPAGQRDLRRAGLLPRPALRLGAVDAKRCATAMVRPGEDVCRRQKLQCTEERLTIRRARREDALQLAKLAEATFRHTFASVNTPEDLDLHCRTSYGESIQANEIADRNRMTLLSEHGERLVGFAQLRSGQGAHLRRG